MATFSIKDLLLGQKNDETVAERLDDKIRRREKNIGGGEALPGASKQTRDRGAYQELPCAAG